MSSVSASRSKRGLPSRVKMRHDRHFVEELAARSEPSIGRLIALSAIEPDPHQPRQAMGKLDELVDSVRQKGILEPILIRRIPKGSSASASSVTYRIISGERRYRAAMAAGLLEVPAIEMEVSEREAREIALIENLQRKDLTPFEEADGFKSLAELHDYTHEQIAKSVGKSRVAVTESLALLKMPPRVRDAVHALGLRSKSILLEVMKAKSEDEMIRLVEKVSSLGLNRSELRREVKRAEGPARTSRRAKPYKFQFRAPDKRYSMSLSFRQPTVDQEDLILALEEILAELKGSRVQGA